MAIDISNTTRRIVYTGSAGTGPYAFAFEVLAETDIAVYLNEAELTLTTDYTVSISGTGTGSITIVVGVNVPTTPDTDDRITIVGDRAIERSTDFTTGGPLFAQSLNDEFDSLTIFTQQNLEQSNRSLRAPNTDPTTIDMTLPLNTIRANKTLAFDANGNPTIGELIGDWKGDWAAGRSYNKRDLIKDTSNDNVYICQVAHTSSGVLPISSNADSAKWDLVVDAAAAGASAAAAAASASAAATSETNAETAETNAETAETNAETAQAAAELAQSAAETAQAGAETAETNAETAETGAQAAQAAAEAVFDNFDDAYLGSKTSDPTVDNDGDPLTDGALYYNTTDNVMKVYDLGTTTWYQLTPTVANQTNINTVAAIASDVTAVAAIDSDVTTVSGISADVTAVAADETDIGTVATNIGNVNDVGAIVADVSTVAGIATEVTNVAGDAANIAAVAGITTEVTAVAGNATNINTVATNNTNVTTVASNITSVNTVATNVTDVVTFATIYLGAYASAPSTSVIGALYYNTTLNQLYIWNGSAWDAAAFSAAGLVASFNTRTGAVTLNSTDVTDALGFTPEDAAGVGSIAAQDSDNVTITGGSITGMSVPTISSDVANKEYVDTIASASLHYHDPVRVESPIALTATYDNGSSGVGATLTNSGTQAALVIDGVTLSTTNRVLIYVQSNAAHNGIYTVTDVGSASTNWVLTRATDADSYGQSDPDALGTGDAFFVQEGDDGAGELYVMTTEGVITIGTTNIVFSQISSSQIYSAGDSLTLSGTVFSVTDDGIDAAKINVTGNGTSGQYLVSDGDGSMSWLTPPAGGVPSGTKMLFVQTAAPTGWTKDTTHDNKSLRVVSGTAGSGGSVDFTTAFASQTPTGSVTITSVTGSAGATTLSTPQIPSHNHAGIGTTFTNSPPSPTNGVQRVTPTPGLYGSINPAPGIQVNTTGARGGGGSHAHPFSFSSGAGTFSGTAIDLAVQYVDTIIATKD